MESSKVTIVHLLLYIVGISIIVISSLAIIFIFQFIGPILLSGNWEGVQGIGLLAFLFYALVFAFLIYCGVLWLKRRKIGWIVAFCCSLFALIYLFLDRSLEYFISYLFSFIATFLLILILWFRPIFFNSDINKLSIYRLVSYTSIVFSGTAFLVSENYRFGIILFVLFVVGAILLRKESRVLFWIAIILIVVTTIFYWAPLF